MGNSEGPCSENYLWSSRKVFLDARASQSALLHTAPQSCYHQDNWEENGLYLVPVRPYMATMLGSGLWWVHLGHASTRTDPSHQCRNAGGFQLGLLTFLSSYWVDQSKVFKALCFRELEAWFLSCFVNIYFIEEKNLKTKEAPTVSANPRVCRGLVTWPRRGTGHVAGGRRGRRRVGPLYVSIRYESRTFPGTKPQLALTTVQYCTAPQICESVSFSLSFLWYFSMERSGEGGQGEGEGPR